MAHIHLPIQTEYHSSPHIIINKIFNMQGETRGEAKVLDKVLFFIRLGMQLYNVMHVIIINDC